MKNVKDYGVQEMDTNEMKKIDGGSFWAVFGGIVFAGLVYEVLTEGSAQCWADFKAGYNEVRSN